MELLGREAADVVSVACSSASSTSFATLSGHGTLTLWDVRLKRKNYLSFTNPNTEAREEASELLYLADRHTAVALCGNTVQLYDTSKSMSIVAEYVHPKECAAFYKNTTSTKGAESTLIADEDGGIFSFSIADGRPTSQLDPCVFSHPCGLPNGADVFGHLDNYCTALFSVDARSSGNTDDQNVARVLFAVGMDGNGALYSNAEGGPMKRAPFCIMDGPQERQKAQMVNPPLVNCAAQRDSVVAVGRADGTYTIYDVTLEGPEALFEAPGHAVNGLCYVDWFSPDVLITASLCGEVTGWKVGDLLLPPPDEDEEEEGDLPEVVAAFAHREVPGFQLATVNCGDCLDKANYVFGDTMGAVTMARVELA